MADNDVRGTGWVTYSGIMLIVAGAIAVIDAIWAFRYSDTIADLWLFENNLEVWGVIWLIVGAVLATLVVYGLAAWGDVSAT